MPASSHSANWVFITPFQWPATDGVTVMRITNATLLPLCAYNNDLSISGGWSRSEAKNCFMQLTRNPWATVQSRGKETWFRTRQRIGTRLAQSVCPSLRSGRNQMCWVWSQSSDSYLKKFFFQNILAVFFLISFSHCKFSLPRYFITRVFLLSWTCWIVSKEKCFKWSFILKTLFILSREHDESSVVGYCE